MRCARRLVEVVVDVCIGERCVQFEHAGSHLRGLFGSYTDPQKMDPLCKGRGISESTVECGLHVRLLRVRHQQTAGSAESADVREQVEMVEGGLEGLHPSHRESSHRS